MSYQFVENINQEDFDNFAINNQDSVKTHFVGSYEWGQVQRHMGWTPHYVGVINNNEIVATAVLLQKNLPLGLSYLYSKRFYDGL